MNEIPVKFIEPNPFQTRVDFDEEKIIELAESIEKVGLLQKILVRPHPEKEGYYQITHGDRRLRAFKHLKRETIPADTRELSDRDMAEIMVIENIQRADLNPLEEARGYQLLIDQFGYTKADLGRRIGKSRSYVSNSIRLTKMDVFLKLCVLCKTLSVWHARIIQGLPEGFRKYQLADTVMDWNLSVAETRRMVNDIKDGEWYTYFIRTLDIHSIIECKEFADIWGGMSRAEFKALKNSMSELGQLEPISVSAHGIIYDGHQRVKAGLELGWKTIRAKIVRWPYQYKGEMRGFYPGIYEKRHDGLEIPENRPPLFPPLNDEQKENMKKFRNMLLHLRKTIENESAEENKAQAVEER